ncbi:hypothetical protein C8J56DRAFT_1123994 [Mycena floridula]|nr:hypothetical protein C8J56DRAFT_1123994 [Mycena floridula]
MKVAVIGSGVSGLASTWLLNEHSDHEVHLFESDSRPGGHTNTVSFHPPDKKTSVDVDTGFIVFNPSTYPNFLRFLRLRDSIQIDPTEMTFSVSRDQGAFEWAGDTLFTVFCQAKRLLDPDMWILIYDVMRFNASARKLVAGWKAGNVDAGMRHDYSIGDFLDREGFSASFRDNYLVPMTAAIWSTPAGKCAMEFPARTLIQFMANHHLLQVTGKPSWLTINGGSHKYVKSILSKLAPQQLHLSTAVKSLSTGAGKNPKVDLTTVDGTVHTFDHVILACHSDAALSILKAGQGLTQEEESVLGTFQWTKNTAILHSDPKLMPRCRSAWSCWNYLTYSTLNSKGQRQANSDTLITFVDGMNDLQHLSEAKYGPVLVTLNAPFEPDAEKVAGRWMYDHPVIDAKAVQAQRLMPTIQGKRSISYAGAWLNFGFHEGKYGFTSGLLAVTRYAPVLPVGSIRMPFGIEFVDGAAWGNAPKKSQGIDPAIEILALIFDILEWTGVRKVFGWFSARVLLFFASILGLKF